MFCRVFIIQVENLLCTWNMCLLHCKGFVLFALILLLRPGVFLLGRQGLKMMESFSISPFSSLFFYAFLSGENIFCKVSHVLVQCSNYTNYVYSSDNKTEVVSIGWQMSAVLGPAELTFDWRATTQCQAFSGTDGITLVTETVMNVECTHEFKVCSSFSASTT